MRIEDLPPWAQAQAANQIMARQRRGSGRSRAPSPALSDDEEEMPRRAASKYHNRKAARITAAGNILEFDSQKEARRYDERATEPDCCGEVHWLLVVEDVKSEATKTRVYAIKRKLMRERLGIDVREV